MNLKNDLRRDGIKKGFALVFVILIAAAMMIPVLMIMSSTIPRRTAVTGEAISDRVLTVSDAVIDRIINQINHFPELIGNDSTLKNGLDNIATYYTTNPPSDMFVVRRDAAKYTTAYLLATLNGGTVWQPDGTSDPASNLQSDLTKYPGPSQVKSRSIWDIEDNIATYLYDLETQTFYVVTDEYGNVKPIINTGINGDITKFHLKNLDTGDYSKVGIQSIDPNYASDNRWIEVDANVQYIDDGSNKPNSTKYQIRVSSYPLTNSNAKNIVRNILAEATLGTINVNVQTSNGSSGTTNTNINPVFKNAIWSGKGLILNGVHTIQSGHMDSKGNIIYDGRAGNGNIFSTGQIIINGNNKIYGNIATALTKDGNGIITNGNLDLGTGHSFIYEQKQTLPDYSTGDETTFKTVAITGGVYNSNYTLNTSSSTINVNGGEVKYYINGDVIINGANNTIKFYPLNQSGMAVDWYINGDLSINGNTTIDFGNTPGTVWVNGNITFNGNVTIIGKGTIISNKSVTFNGTTRSIYSDASSKLAIISRGQDGQGGITLNGNQTIYGLFYAPHSNIIYNGTGSVFGALIAGGYVTSSSPGVIVNGNQDIIYDTELSSTSNSAPPLPGSTTTYTISGISYSASAIYRLSWRETISKQVTNAYIQSLTPIFDFRDPPTGT